MGRHFLAPPKDEVALRQAIFPEVEAWDGGLTKERLKVIQENWGVDGASMALYLYLQQCHAGFLEAVNREAATPCTGAAGATLLLVPGLYYEERPDLGGDGEIVLQAARACGFEARRVPTLSLGTVQDNAQILARELKDIGEGRVLVASLSVGALQVRQLLAGLEADQKPAFQGWLNLGGTPFGAHAIERMLNTRTRRMAGRLLARFQGLPFAAVEESMPSHALWQGPFPEVSGLRAVTVLPIPLEGHVQKPLQTRFAELKAQGPNDGMVLLAESLPPGEVYPLWGCDHLLRTSAAGEAIYRLLRWFRKDLALPQNV
jgi:hypothetical protein